MSAGNGRDSFLSTRLNIQKLIHFCCNSAIKAERGESIERTYFRWSIFWNDIYICGIFIVSRNGGGTLRRRGNVNGLQVAWMNPSSHILTLTHLHTMAVWSLILHHKTTESFPADGRAKAFPHISIFFSNNLPNASFKDVHVFYLVTSWIRGPGLPLSQLRDKDSTLKWRALSENECLSDTFQASFRWFCWLHMQRRCFKLIYVNQWVLWL